MTNINLLPWREELREERKREFFAALGAIVAIAGVLIFFVDRYYNAGIDSQVGLNDFLKAQIVVLDGELEEIRELRAQKELLTERMAVIQDLQGTRPVIVRLFDELVRSLPEDVYFTTVSRRAENIRLEGIAESNSLVSALMRQLDSSDWFSDPVLEQITASPGGSGDGQENTRNSFLLNVKVTTPTQELE